MQEPVAFETDAEISVRGQDPGTGIRSTVMYNAGRVMVTLLDCDPEIIEEHEKLAPVFETMKLARVQVHKENLPGALAVVAAEQDLKDLPWFLKSIFEEHRKKIVAGN